MNRSNQFPTKPISDWIIIERIIIKDVATKKSEKSGIKIMEGAEPKNILELEKKRLAEHAIYDDAEKLLLKKWDEHPNQGIVMAVGPGRDIGNGVLLVPQVKVGEHILYRGKTGDPMIINKKLYWVIKEHDIFSTVPAADLIK